MPALRVFGSAVTIRNAYNFTSLHFPSLVSVGTLNPTLFVIPSFTVSDLPLLTTFDDCPQLVHVQGTIVVRSNLLLASIQCFSKLSNATHASFVNLPALTALNLNSVVRASYLRFEELPALTLTMPLLREVGLYGVQGLDRALRVENTTASFPALKTVMDLDLDSIYNLADLSWFPLLRNISGTLTIQDVPNISSLGGSSLVYCSSLHIEGTPLLTSLAAFLGVTLDTDLRLFGLPLTTLHGLEGARSLESLQVMAMGQLTDLGALAGATVTGDIRLLVMEGLTSISALYNVQQLSLSLEIMDCPLLPSLNGLGNLTSVNAGVSIEYCLSLTDISALTSLGTVGGGFVSNSPFDLSLVALGVTNLTGLSSVRFLGGNLIIQMNPYLETLAGLETLYSIAGGLSITQNPVLRDISALRFASTIPSSLNFVMMEFAECPLLASLAGITINPNVASLIIRNMSLVPDLGGLAQSWSVMDEVIITDNPLLADVTFRLTTSALTTMHVVNNPSLVTLSVAGPNHMITDLVIANNSALETVYMPVAYGLSMVYQGNDAVTQFELCGLTQVFSSEMFFDLPHVCCGSLSFTYVPGLVHCAACPAVATQPSILYIDPPNGATNVSADAVITIVFNQSMSRCTVEPAMSLLDMSYNYLPQPLLNFTWNANRTVVVATPSRQLLASGTYQFTFTTPAVSISGPTPILTEQGQTFNPALSTTFSTVPVSRVECASNEIWMLYGGLPPGVGSCVTIVTMDSISPQAVYPNSNVELTITGTALKGTAAFLVEGAARPFSFVGTKMVFPLPSNLSDGYHNLTVVKPFTPYADMGIQVVSRTDLLYVTTFLCGQFQWYHDGCAPCPDGAVCPGGNRAWPLSGYWSQTETDSPRACAVTEACPGAIGELPEYPIPEPLASGARPTDNCAYHEGYSGFACTECMTGFYKSYGRCETCGQTAADRAKFIGLLIAAAAIFFCIALAVSALKDRWIDSFVAGLIAFQQFIVIGRTASAQLNGTAGDNVRNVFSLLAVVNFEFEFVKPSCSFGVVSFIGLYWGTIGMLCGACILVVAAAALRALIMKCCCGDRTVAGRFRGEFKPRAIRGLLIMGSFVYIQVCLRSVEGVYCKDITGVSRLSVELATQCYTSDHLKSIVFIWIIILLYCVGYPIFCWFLIRRVVKGPGLGDPVALRTYGYLYRGLHYRFWWFRLLTFVTNFLIGVQNALSGTVSLRLFISGLLFIINVGFVGSLFPFTQKWNNVFNLITGLGNGLFVLIFLGIGQQWTLFLIAFSLELGVPAACLIAWYYRRGKKTIERATEDMFDAELLDPTAAAQRSSEEGNAGLQPAHTINFDTLEPHPLAIR